MKVINVIIALSLQTSK